MTILSDATSVVRYSPAQGTATSRKRISPHQRVSTSPRVQRLRQGAFDLRHRGEQRIHHAPRIPALEPRRVVEHKTMRHGRRGHAAHFVEANAWLATH